MTMRIGKLHLQRVHKKVWIASITPLEPQRVVGCPNKLNGRRSGWVRPCGHLVHCTQTSRTNTVDGLNAYSGDKRYILETVIWIISFCKKCLFWGRQQQLWTIKSNLLIWLGLNILLYGKGKITTNNYKNIVGKNGPKRWERRIPKRKRKMQETLTMINCDLLV